MGFVKKGVFFSASFFFEVNRTMQHINNYFSWNKGVTEPQPMRPLELRRKKNLKENERASSCGGLEGGTREGRSKVYFFFFVKIRNQYYPIVGLPLLYSPHTR